MKNPRNCVDFIFFDACEIQCNLMRHTFYLNVKQEVHHIAIFNDVLFPF